MQSVRVILKDELDQKGRLVGCQTNGIRMGLIRSWPGSKTKPVE